MQLLEKSDISVGWSFENFMDLFFRNQEIERKLQDELKH
jgi:hypothetical protein